MLGFLFTIGIIVLVVKIAKFALKAAWGLTKVVLFVIAFPAIVVAMFVAGLFVLAIPILIIALIASFVIPAIV